MTSSAPVAVLPPLALGEPASLDIKAYRGDTGSFRVVITRDGAPLDVSAATWDADIRADPDTPVLATMTVAPVAGQTNAVDVTLPAGASTQLSGEAVYDLEMSLGTPPVVTTILRGAITITPDVSRPSVAPLPPEPEPEGVSAPQMAPGSPLALITPGVTPERVGGPDAPVAPFEASLHQEGT